jgi:electron transport complex protein RnfB
MNFELIKLALAGLAVLGLIGFVFGLALALAAHKFGVSPDPKIEEVKESLAGANCGACGFAGCEDYAEAVVTDPDVPPDLCFPGGDEVAEVVARLTNKTAQKRDGYMPVVFCRRPQGNVRKRHCYIGHQTCKGADMAFRGPFDCQYGCVGFGDCAEACPVDAIKMIDNFPVIDEERCIRCGACVEACPKGIIKMVPEKTRVLIRCSSKDSAKVTQAVCDAGCLHCKACIKKCPAGAISEVDGKVHIDVKKCTEYGPKCGEVCVEACKKRQILQPFRPKEKPAASDGHGQAKAA